MADVGIYYDEENATHTVVDLEHIHIVICTPNTDCTYEVTPTCVERNNGDVISSQLENGSYEFPVPDYGSWMITNKAVSSTPVVEKNKFVLPENPHYNDSVDYIINKTWENDTKKLSEILNDTYQFVVYSDYNNNYFFDEIISKSEVPLMIYTDSKGNLRMISGSWLTSLEDGVGYNATFDIGSYINDIVNSDIELNMYATLKEPPVMYYVTQNLTNCTSDCTITSIQKDSDLTIVVTPNEGYSFTTTPTATMNGTNVDSSQLETGYSFSFTDIDGDIVVNATAKADSPVDENNADYGFINIYNPTQSELQSIASKFFMNFSSGTVITLTEYIINMFQIFGKPLVLKNKQSVKFGKYDTTIGANVVREPKIEIDCGAIEVKEKYNSALDYDSYVNARIWLPFCGFFDIQSDLFMNGKLYLSYTIDVLTGKCIASLKTSQLEYSVVYNFCGSASMKIPYYVNNNDERANGAIANDVYNLADKTPYVLLTRKISATPDSSQLDGINSNIKVDRLGDLTGYTKCSSVDVRGIKATQGELEQLESYLKKGVIL